MEEGKMKKYLVGLEEIDIYDEVEVTARNKTLAKKKAEKENTGYRVTSVEEIK